MFDVSDLRSQQDVTKGNSSVIEGAGDEHLLPLGKATVALECLGGRQLEDMLEGYAALTLTLTLTLTLAVSLSLNPNGRMCWRYARRFTIEIKPK